MSRIPPDQQEDEPKASPGHGAFRIIVKSCGSSCVPDRSRHAWDEGYPWGSTTVDGNCVLPCSAMGYAMMSVLEESCSSGEILSILSNSSQAAHLFGIHQEPSGMIEDAIREYLERDEERRRRLAETKEALAELEAGELVDGEPVLAWLETWGTDHEREPPSP